MRRAHAASGFTLVEVLIALAIVAFGMSALMTVLTSSADTTTRLREKSFAEWVGFNQLSTTRLTLTAPNPGTMEGDVEFANSSFHWLQTIDQIELPGVLRITVQVRRNLPGAAAVTLSKTEWLATVVGFYGTAQGAANGTVPTWNAVTMSGGGNGRTGPGTGLGGFGLTTNTVTGNGVTTPPTNIGGVP